MTGPPRRGGRAFGATPSILRWTAVVALGAILAIVPEAVFLTFGGGLFACGLAVPARWISARTGLSTAWAVSLTCVVGTAIVGAVVALVGAEVSAQLRDLAGQAPHVWTDIEEAIRESPVGGLFPEVPRPRILAADAAAQGAEALSGMAAALAGGLVLAWLAFYFAVQPDLYREAAVGLVPPTGRERARRVLDEMGQLLASWLLGRLVGMTVVGVLVGGSLALLGVPTPLALGLLAGLLDFVPNVGPIVAAVPGVLLAASQGATQALVVMGAYLVIQLLEAYVLTPLIDRRTAFVPPALVIVAQLVFGLLFGGLGLAFATPIVAAGMVLVRQLWLEDKLGEGG